MNPLRLSTPAQEGVLRASKSLKMPLLLDEEEMESLLTHLGAFQIYVVSEVVSLEHMLISKQDFLEKYKEYVQALKRGERPDEMRFRRYFSSVFTTTPEALYAMQVGEDRFLVKPIKPVIQLQAHHFFVSSVDGKFHSMVLGKESVTWGIQFSYPQLAQDPLTHAFSKVRDTPEFPNTAIFTRLAKWVRQNSVPTPFIFQGKQQFVPIRIGKKCFSWIKRHPELAERGLQIG